MIRKSETVSFRLDPEMLRHLERAAGVINVSRGEYAKHLVIAGLTNSYAETTKSILLELRHDLRLLRSQHVTATHALLVAGGKTTKEQAEKFIATSLLKNESDSD